MQVFLNMGMKNSAAQPRSHCPISLALDIFGDKWSLLVLRDLVFKSKQHFRDFLASEEKIATNVLSNRLRILEANGIVVRTPDPANARQVIYTLTEKGKDLIPVLIDLIVWGATYEESAVPAEFLQRAKQDREGLIATVTAALSASQA